MKHRIVCAALRSGLVIVLGPRHLDAVMQQQIRQLDGPCVGIDWSKAERGFIDCHGRFLTPQKAWNVAKAAGQVVRRVEGDDARGGTLHPENMY